MIVEIRVFFLDNIWMRLSLHKKLVIAILLSICSVIIIMLLLISWTFDRGFKAHVMAEVARNDNILIESLVEHYVTVNNWSFIQENTELWQDLTFSSHRKAHLSPHGIDRKPATQYHPDRYPPPPRFLRSERALLSKDKQVIIGNINIEELDSYLLKPLILSYSYLCSFANKYSIFWNCLQ